MSKPEYMVNDIDLRKVDNTTLGEDQINAVVDALEKVVHHYERIGRSLRLPNHVVKRIQSEHKTDYVNGLNAIVTEYIQQAGKYNHERPTMWKIVTAVSHGMGGNNHSCAKEIAKKFPPGSIQKLMNPEQETLSDFEDVTQMQSPHDRRRSEPTPTQAPRPHPIARPSASTPALSHHQQQQQMGGQGSSHPHNLPHQNSDPTGNTQAPVEAPKRNNSHPQSPRFTVGGDTMPAIHEQTGSADQGYFTTSYNQGDISSQQRRQPSGTTSYYPYEQSQQSQMVVSGGPATPTKCYSQLEDQGTSPQARGQHTRQEKREFIEHREMSLPESEIRKRMVGVNKAPANNPEDIPDSPTSVRPKRSGGRGRSRGRGTNPQKERRPGASQGTPPSYLKSGPGFKNTSQWKVGQSQTSAPVSGSSEGFGRIYTSTPSAAREPSGAGSTPSTYMTAKFGQMKVTQTSPSDNATRQPIGYTAPPPPQEQLRTPNDSLTSVTSGDSITESSLNSSTYSEPPFYDNELPPNKYYPKGTDYSKPEFQPSKYSQHGMPIESQSQIPPEAALGDSHPNYPATGMQPTTYTSPRPQPKFYSRFPPPGSQDMSATGPPPAIQQAANLPALQASVTASDPTQSQFSATQSSYSAGQSFSKGQQTTMDLNTMASVPPDEQPETLSSISTGTMRSASSEREREPLLTEKDATHKLGNSIVASVQSRSGVKSYVHGIDQRPIAKIENSSLVSGRGGPVGQTARRFEEGNIVYPSHLQPVETGPSIRNDPNQGPFSSPPQHYDQPPPLLVRGPHSIASSKSSQSVDRPRGAKEGAPPATMELVSMEEKVVLKPGNYGASPDVEREDVVPQYQENIVAREEPNSMASTSSMESASLRNLSTSMIPSDVEGKTKYGQCSSIPSSLGSSVSPRQQYNEVRPSNLSVAGPSAVAGSSHIQQEYENTKGEQILDYQTLLSDSHEGFRPCEDGGHIPFQSFEAFQLHGEERYRKIKLKFDLLCPIRGERVISDEDDYRMENHPHGLALIINNEKFKRHSQREGTDVDEVNLTMTLRYLGYNVEIHRNLTTKEMVKLFKEVKVRDHSACDSFVCCILTHGESGRLFGSDSSSVLIETLTGELCAASCHQLKGKPKIFFIQACRGKLKCHKVAADSGQLDDNQNESSDTEEASDEEQDHDEVDHGARHVLQDPQNSTLKRAIVRSLSIEAVETADRITADADIPDAADFFFGFATPFGHVAWRDLDHGSWYISELCRALCMYSVSKSLGDIMTKVANGVGDRYYYGSYKQAPETTSRLRKNVFF